MCLIALAFDCHPRYRLILAANRDEFRTRNTEPAGFWPDAPHLLAGRDLHAGGTWIGVTTSGKFAAVTNYRDARQQVPSPPSRGTLVADYLRDPRMSPADLLHYLEKHANRYDGFNLLYGTITDLRYYTNRGGSSGPLTPGIHTLSNHLLDTPWPKSVVAGERLGRIVHGPGLSIPELMQAMADPAPYEDALLPDTGIGLDRERFLSPIFIRGSRYGTRSTTVILAENNGAVGLVEQSHDNPYAPRREFKFIVSL